MTVKCPYCNEKFEEFDKRFGVLPELLLVILGIGPGLILGAFWTIGGLFGSTLIAGVIAWFSGIMMALLFGLFAVDKVQCPNCRTHIGG